MNGRDGYEPGDYKGWDDIPDPYPEAIPEFPMTYQVRELETAQKLIDKLTRALRFWLPDDLTENDTDFERWYEDRQLADGQFRTSPPNFDERPYDASKERF